MMYYSILGWSLQDDLLNTPRAAHHEKEHMGNSMLLLSSQ
jgi:hypothetical protein